MNQEIRREVFRGIIIGYIFVFVGIFHCASQAMAHEAYVMPKSSFWEAIRNPSGIQVTDALDDPANLYIAIAVTFGVVVFLYLNFFFMRSHVGMIINAALERAWFIGQPLVRLSVAVAFFFAASGGSLYGPELSLEQMPGGPYIRVLLYITSFLIFLGLFSQLAGFISLLVFISGYAAFGSYVLTYLNYLGEIIVLAVFGSGRWSVDNLIFGGLAGWRKRLHIYETTVLRVFYGASILYAAISVKFLNPEVTVKVVRDWELTKFHWLFPGDPLLITLGAGIAEAVIGIFIMAGFQLKATVLISLFYITLSLFYFQEAVWPHLMLYGISVYLLVVPDAFSLDVLLHKRKMRSFEGHRRANGGE